MIKELHKKWSFPLGISSLNVIKFAGICGFEHIYWRNLEWKTSFFVQWGKLISDWFQPDQVADKFLSRILLKFDQGYVKNIPDLT